MSITPYTREEFEEHVRVAIYAHPSLHIHDHSYEWDPHDIEAKTDDYLSVTSALDWLELNDEYGEPHIPEYVLDTGYAEYLKQVAWWQAKEQRDDSRLRQAIFRVRNTLAKILYRTAARVVA